MSPTDVPGDKSIAHRFLILATLADGESSLENVPRSLDVESTVSCLRSLGAVIEREGKGAVRLSGPTAWRAPPGPLDCGNSGTTARLLLGLLTGLGLEAELVGDSSLSRRPMDRVVYPLQAMGGRIKYVAQVDRLPVRVEGRASGALRSLRYRPRISSAQVRGALLLAAVTARVDLEVLDRLRPRDHTERILAAMGAPVTAEDREHGDRVRLSTSGWGGRLAPLDARVPGDLSAAAFLAVAGLLRGRSVTFRSIGLNPSRAGWVAVVEEMGAGVEKRVTGSQGGEPVGDLVVRPGRLGPLDIGARDIPGLIDELPALAVLASRIPGVSRIRGASELRVKESDRLARLAGNLTALGVDCEELEDGLIVRGTSERLAGDVRTGGDHRITMAFAALGASPDAQITVDEPECVSVSFPGFWEALNGLLAEGAEA